MALYKSTLATNLYASPAVRGESHGGEVRRYGTSMTLTTDHDSADVVALFPVPSNMQVRSVQFSTDGSATTGAADIGIYTLSSDGATATAVDADLFASAQTITSAGDLTEVIDESSVFTIADRYLPLWEAAGESSDPGGYYWICYTLTANVDASTVTAVDVTGVW